jgi:hypothetical protein
MRHISSCGLNLYSRSAFINFEELDLDDSLRVETLNCITLLSSVNLVTLNSQSDVLCPCFLFFIIHDIIGIIFIFGQNPLVFEVIHLNILLDIVPYGSWLD